MISPQALQRDVLHLTQSIGVRLAGSDKEMQAAEYMRDRFLEYVPVCTIEEFPVMQRVVEEETLEILIDEKWVSFPASLLNSAPGTNGECVEAELVFFDSHTDYQRSDLSFLKGKAVIHYGVHIKKEEDYLRLMQAEPAFLLMVDTRYTGTGPLADGLFPAYVEKYGAIPTMDVAYFDAWDWRVKGATKARLTVVGKRIQCMSHNVVAEIPGTDPNALCIYCGSHIDSQAYTVGADDNAIGSAILLELARVLSQKPHRHTIRLIAFGAEEQLSVGSSQYVRRHREQVKREGKFMCNFDSCGTMTGWNFFIMNAAPELRDRLTAHYNTHDIYYQEMLSPDPTNDLFPFTVLGVPGLTAMRRNCECGKFYHHQPTDTPDKISFETTAKVAAASAKFILQLVDDDNLTVLPGTDPAVETDVQRLWGTTYGGW